MRLYLRLYLRLYFGLKSGFNKIKDLQQWLLGE